MTPEVEDQAQGVAAPRRSLAETWIEVAADAGGLVRTGASMARVETTENLKGLGLQSAKIMAGLLLLSVALIFLTIAAVVALAAVIGLIWALLAVMLVCVIVGVLLVRSGVERLQTQNILPERTLGRMSRDLEQLAARADPVRSDAERGGD